MKLNNSTYTKIIKRQYINSKCKGDKHYFGYLN